MVNSKIFIDKEFYNKCTKNFTNEWLEKIKILKEWIIQM